MTTTTAFTPRATQTLGLWAVRFDGEREEFCEV